MRLIKVAATIGVAAAMFIGTAGTSSAAPSDFTKPLRADEKIDRGNDVGVQRTDGHSFMEINAAGQLVRWTRAGETFSGQVRGQGWENTRQITSLDPNTFLEINSSSNLVKWTWNGSTYVPATVGTAWYNTKVITGIAPGRFLEINGSGELLVWEFGANNGLSRWVIGIGWHNTRTIAGTDDIDFLEIKGDGILSEWYDFFDGGANLREIRFEEDFSAARLMVGTEFNHFLVIDQAGNLIEFLGDNSGYTPVQRGWGWNGTRLVG
ncbi:hypothetical protein KIPE111705_28865 [Kibdelosporangium persicum]|uniref:Bulb-type lectin domain-containing protein n=1 Tax=Kibdelosporangium persicum TaxID=2698649 RepID=A0ABX2F5T4_9PSEU|nr:hypothetical protein [Kibdelosporangium persicum]NRN66335.1 hypothetical protein [Kibdelosporangium persicum]